MYIWYISCTPPSCLLWEISKRKGFHQNMNGVQPVQPGSWMQCKYACKEVFNKNGYMPEFFCMLPKPGTWKYTDRILMCRAHIIAFLRRSPTHCLFILVKLMFANMYVYIYIPSPKVFFPVIIQILAAQFCGSIMLCSCFYSAALSVAFWVQVASKTHWPANTHDRVHLQIE